jgi:hypothetical protein
VQAPLTRLVRSIGIEAGEGRVFVWAVTIFFLVHSASVALNNASDTFFLKRIGVALLPAAFLVSSLLLVATTSAVARLAARRAQMPLLTRALFALAAVLVPLWLLALADVRGVFIVLVLVAKQIESIALLLFWVALGGRLHARQAKRLYGPIIAGGTLGEILGSFASAIIGRSLGVAALLPAAAVMLALAGAFAGRAGSPPPARSTRLRTRGAARAPSALALLLPLWRESRLFKILAVSALLCGTLGPMLYFQFAYVADLATQGVNGELHLLSLYAAFRGWLNVAVLILQLLGTARLFRRIGVPLAATLSPLIYLLGFFGLSLRLGLEAAAGAMAGTTLQDHAVYDPAQQVLVTLFPERQRAAATTLIEGPLQRAGAALGNLLVLGVIAVAEPGWIAMIGLPIAGLWVAAALRLWRIYPTLLLEMASLRRLHVDEGLALSELVDPVTQRLLAASLVDANPQRVRAACTLVAEGPLQPAVAALAHAAARAPADTRPLLLAALHRLLDRNGDARTAAAAPARQLEALLDQSTSALERASLVEAYARLVPDLGPGSPGAARLSRLLTDPAEAVRLAATARLHCAGALELTSDDLDALLAAALASDDPTLRHVALDELRTALLGTCAPGVNNGDRARWTRRIALLDARLADPRDRARAAEILADLAARHGPQVAVQGELLLPYAHDPEPRVRSAVLRFIGHAHLEQQVGWAVERLASDDEGEAAAAASALRALGPAATDTLLDALHCGKRAARRAVLPLLRDLHVDAATLRTLIAREVQAIQRTRLVLYGLAAGRVSDLVVQRLRERVDEEAHSVLLLLAALHDENRLAILGRLLARSPHGRGRAVLLEALEALLPPEERVRLVPLLDDVDSRAAQAAADALGYPLPSFEAALRDAMAGPDALAASFLAGTLDRGRVADRTPVMDSAPDRESAEEDGMLNRVEIVLHLRSLDLFARLTTRQLSAIAAVVHEEVYPPGAVIVREGEFGECMYLVLSGEVLISRAGQYELTAGAGEIFGEMSLFDGETRSATVSAVRRVRVLRLDRHDLFELIEEEPAIAIGICQTLSRHARDSIKRLEEKK